MKKEFVLGLFVLLFGFGLVGAGSCGDDQTIMRLHSAVNSHVSAWDQEVVSYVEEICYNDIFGSAYTGANPHACTGDNRVLSLSSSSNAHASEVTDTVYNYEVCYGDLECIYDSSAGNTCSNEGEIVARLYSSSNSHVSYVSDTNYPIKICCKSSRVYWADMGGNEISEADFGDRVKMIKLGGVSGVFEIKEEDVLFDDDIRSVVGISIDGDVVGGWEISAEDMDKTNDYDKFYFMIDEYKSDYLSIDLNGDDDPMVVDILSPSCGAYFDKGDIISIVVTAEDNDDVIDGEVKFGGEIIGTFSNGGTSIERTLDVSGNFQIIVEATNTRNRRSRAISNIMVLDKSGGSYVDGEYVAACIDLPRDFSNIEGSIVEFDASTTRAIRVVGGVFDLLVPDEGDVFSWYWRFMPENVVREILDTTDSFAYRFTAEFPVAGDNSASLRVEI